MKILSFAPYLGIWQHALPEALLLDALSSKHEIYHIQCDGIFKAHCVTMCSYGVMINDTEKLKNKACAECIKNRGVINHSFDFSKSLVENYINDEEINKIDNHLKKITKENFLYFYLDGIPIGKYAYYLVSLQYKKKSYDMSDFQFIEYMANLKNTLISYYSSLNMIKLIKPDAVIIYNTHYPTNRVFSEVCIKNNITPFFIHAGPNLARRLNSLYIGKYNHYEVQKNQFLHWKELKHKSTPIKTFELIREHYKELIIAQNVFVYSSSVLSNKIDLKGFFKIKSNQKILLLTMSSFDERFAAESIDVLDKQVNLIFESQVAWVEETINFVSKQRDIFLIIRVHPREFPNKRENVLSENAILLEKIFKNLPSNVAINWPEQKIPIYSFAGIIDVALNFTSTVGKELTLFGVPVLTYAHNGLSYPTDINFLAKTKKEYFNMIRTLAYDDFDLMKLVYLFRWYAIEFYYTVIYFEQGRTLSERKKSYFERIRSKMLSKIDDRYDHKRDSRNYFDDKNKNMILSFFEKKYNTFIDLYDFEESISLDEEFLYIEKTVRHILHMAGMDRNPRISRTQKLLNNFDNHNRSQ